MSRMPMVPGWKSSGPDLWQSEWQFLHPKAEIVEQRDWYDVDHEEWVAALHESIAFQVPGASRLVSGVLLVAPPDPHMVLASAARVAADWDRYFINAGPAGHMNPASGFGPWPRGERLLDQLVSWSNGRFTNANSEHERAA